MTEPKYGKKIINASPDYHKNFQGITHYEGPCIVCGKDIKNPAAMIPYLHATGECVHPKDVAAGAYEDEEIGGQPIGAGCLSKLPDIAEWLKQ